MDSRAGPSDHEQSGSFAPNSEYPVAFRAEASGSSRILQNIVTREQTQAQYGDNTFHGDHTIYGGRHVHHHPPNLSTAATPPPRKPINTLKWRKDPQFVGREDTLESIKSILEEYGCAALTGAGGIGKSQTAIEFCWRWREKNPQFHVFWIYSASLETFDAALTELARKLRLDCSSFGNNIAGIRDGVKDWLDDNSDWLMVIDNADTYDDFFGHADSRDDPIRDLLPLPRPGTAMILYTSRHAKIGDELTEAHCLPLGSLSLADSTALLCNKLGTSAVGETEGLFKEVLALQDRTHGVLASTTTLNTLHYYEFLVGMGTPDGASSFVCHRAAVILEVLSDSEISNYHPGPQLSSLIEAFSNHEKAHLPCVRLLRTYMHRCKTLHPLRNVARTMQTKWCALERIQTKQFMISSLKRYHAVRKLVKHPASCGICGSVIAGIRHKCLLCEEHDVCAPCMSSDVASTQCCWSAAASPKTHRYAPMFDETCKHREAASWTASVSLVDASQVVYSSAIDPDRCPIIPMRERWHKDLRDAKGWESEPDEGRRIKTRFAGHYARKHVVGSEIDSPRVRSRSLPPTRSTDISPQVWRDHMSELRGDKELWFGLRYIALGRY